MSLTKFQEERIMEKRLYSNSSVLFSRENLLRPGNYEAHGTLGIVLTPFTWRNHYGDLHRLTCYLSSNMSEFMLDLSTTVLCSFWQGHHPGCVEVCHTALGPRSHGCSCVVGEMELEISCHPRCQWSLNRKVLKVEQQHYL